MALAQTTLGGVVHISTGAAATVYTVSSGKPVYIRSLIVHGLNDEFTNNVEIFVVPNNGGSVGTASSVNRIAKLGISTCDTFFFECAYPITLVNNNDTVQVKNSFGLDAINVVVLGDKEA